LLKITAFIVISPVLGFVFGYLFMALVLNIFRNSSPDRVDKYFRRGQLFSAAFYSLGHGMNDAQKTMGIIYILLIASGHLGAEAAVPLWVIVGCNLTMGIGTLFGGWRIVKTMGQRMVKLKPVGGFCAELGGAVMLLGTALAGIPVSTTHTITGSIMGVGATQRASAVKWGVATQIVWAWILTIPVSFAVGAVIYQTLFVFR
jgi:PiT family inorganic phosphate transporter